MDAHNGRAELIASMADAELTTDQVAACARGSIAELRRRAESERASAAMDALIAVNERRARLILAASRLEALRTLRRLMGEDEPKETSRKAAVDVLSLRWGAPAAPARRGASIDEPAGADDVRGLLERLDELAREEEARLAAEAAPAAGEGRDDAQAD
jgi:hypothetical protein